MIKSGLSKSAILVATKQQVSCELGEEAAILNMKNSVYYGLNPVGARVWQLLQQPRRFGELRDVILNEYDVTTERAEADLADLLERLLSEGLVEMSAPPDDSPAQTASSVSPAGKSEQKPTGSAYEEI